jgi:hypothetical protein
MQCWVGILLAEIQKCEVRNRLMVCGVRTADTEGFCFNTLYRASFVILYNDQPMHNYFTNYRTPTAVVQWLRCCAKTRYVAGSIPAGVSGFFIDIKSFLSHYVPGVDSTSNRNEYQEYFLGVTEMKVFLLF